jgi:hypothetical protein
MVGLAIITVMKFSLCMQYIVYGIRLRHVTECSRTVHTGEIFDFYF